MVIIISGNLTGFSRFYTSVDANDVSNEANFNFDYRNYLSFMADGEKAYSISFSPKVVAVSLITRILDSFRRPGILVVSALIPRHQFVSGETDGQDNGALYRLLNEINDKFYEKNFQNGMINQNPVVLMQDYYSDIIRNYTLVGDSRQKGINSSIDVNTPNKRIGYIAAVENDMPQYLSSLFRKSYSGYHCVFFSEKAPANINEPAKEDVTYKVIVNGEKLRTEVHLTDKIPDIKPKNGEIDIKNKNFTYEQIVNDKTGMKITGSIEGDTIILDYNFPKEEKTIYFKFYCGEDEIQYNVIRPIIIESGNIRKRLSSNPWKFIGEEIYNFSGIECENTRYTTVNSGAENLSRHKDNDTIDVYVQQVYMIDFKADNKPKDVTLINRNDPEKKISRRNVTGILKVGLDNPSEWDVVIESEHYESMRFPASQTVLPPFKSKPVSNTVKDGKSNPGNITVVNTPNENKNRERYINYGIGALLALLVIITAWIFWPTDKKTVDKETKIVTFRMFSSDDKLIDNPEVLDLLSLTFENEGIDIKDGKTKFQKQLSHNKGDDFAIKISVYLSGNNETPISSEEIKGTEIKDTCDIYLPKNQEYLLRLIDPARYADPEPQPRVINKNGHQDNADGKLVKDGNTGTPVKDAGQKERTPQKNDPLDSEYIQYSGEDGGYLFIENGNTTRKLTKDDNNALKYEQICEVLSTIMEGKIPQGTYNYLCQYQLKTLEELNGLARLINESGLSDDDVEKFMKKLHNRLRSSCKSFYQVKENILSNKPASIKSEFEREIE